MKDRDQKNNGSANLPAGQGLPLYDPFTGLPARLLLEERLRHTLERCGREGSRAAVLVIGLDGFETVNDSFGHAAGDALLGAVGERLGVLLRRQDTLSHLGGEHFVLVLEALHEYPEAEIMAGRIQAALLPPFSLPEGYNVYVRASIGISVYPQDGDNAQDLLVGADAAVHRARDLGGNQFCYYTSELNVQARATLEMEEGLRQALSQKEFVLYYQPKVDLRSGRIVGAEALLRWQRPGCGLVSPLDFVPAAEKNGLIEPIGAWVIEEACRQMRAWRDIGLAEVRVAVNVSARQFRCGGLEETIITALERYAVEPRQLMLELTESMLMADPEDAVARMIALKRLGVRLSLDDFGTGYASLAYLGRFPIDQMKIDRSFVTDIVTDPGAATIAASVIALAHRMRVSVIAEGVENEAQLGYLRQNGCEEVQGYFFSTPISADDFAAMLAQGKRLAVPEEFLEGRALLIVDDEPGVLAALRRVLADEGYRVLTADSAAQGLELLAKNPVQVVLSDQRMAGMNGTEFLGRVKALYPDTVRMILSGYAELETVMQAVNEGAVHKFFKKPWDADQLREHLHGAFRYHETISQSRTAGAQEHEELKSLFSQVKRVKDEWTMAMDGVADLVFLLDDVGGVLRCNKAVCELFGASYPKVLGRNVESLLAEAGLSPAPIPSEADQDELLHSASQRTFLRSSYEPGGQAGEVQSVIILRDISERKQAERVLKENEDKFRSIYEGSNDAIMLLDDTGFIDCNRRTLEMFGLSRKEEFIALHPSQLSPPVQSDGRDSLSAANEEIATALAQGYNRFEWVHCRKKGEDFPVEVMLSAFDYLGKRVLQATVRDISERKQALLFMEENRKRLERALGEISGMIRRFTEDADHSEMEAYFPLPLEYVPCWKKMGCDKEECPCYGREPVQCWAIAGTRCKGAVQGRFAQKSKDCLACKVYKEATDDPVVGINMQFSWMMHIIEKKNSELKKAYDELKATQSQFVQQEKMASIGQLAAGVAHEINNPIGFVTSNLGTLQKYMTRLEDFLQTEAELFPVQEADDRTTRLAEIRKKLKIEAILEDLPSLIAESLDGVERVRKIVQNLKSFSRIDQSDYSLEDINQCLDDTLNIIWNELKYKCTVKKEYGDLPPTRCYPQQLNQVFMNLLVNAAQAIETKGEIVITTRASETEITVVIADSGGGIPQENLNRIFEPFFTTKEVGKGTGLGLSITYDIVTKKHGGRIEVASEPGKGTTFVVTLPVKTE